MYMAFKHHLIFLIIGSFITLTLAGCREYSEATAKPIICITFDDAHETIFDNGYPILSEFGYEPTCYVNSGLIGRDIRLTFAELRELQNEGNWEIGGHTINHINMPDFSYAEVYAEVIGDYDSLTTEGLVLKSFALPSGHATDENYEIILSKYENVRTSRNSEMRNPINRRDLGYFPFQSDYTPETIIARIESGVYNNEALVIIGFHRLQFADNGAIDNCTPEQFRTIMTYLSDNGFDVLRLDKALDRLIKK